MSGFFFVGPQGQPVGPDGTPIGQDRQRVAQALMQNGAPRTIGEGLSALGDGFLERQQRQNSMFPTAPQGSDPPSFFTAMKNLFSGGNNGGLF